MFPFYGQNASPRQFFSILLTLSRSLFGMCFFSSSFLLWLFLCHHLLFSLLVFLSCSPDFTRHMHTKHTQPHGLFQEVFPVWRVSCSVFCTRIPCRPLQLQQTVLWETLFRQVCVSLVFQFDLRVCWDIKRRDDWLFWTFLLLNHIIRCSSKWLCRCLFVRSVQLLFTFIFLLKCL